MDQHAFNPKPGVPELLEPGVRRVLAPNPSPMTFRGTNTYIIGTGKVAVIDPGPDLPSHLDALLTALEPGEIISHIFVTHSHLDHSPLARPLAERTGAPILAYGDSKAGRSKTMEALASQGVTGGGEGVDPDFSPDIVLAEKETVAGGDWSLTALWTPGHFCNHLSFAMQDILFTGDHVMGWASTMVSPPDGDLTAFMASTERLLTRNDRVYYPGHGAPILDPRTRAKWLIAHRKSREAQICSALGTEPQSIPALTQHVYHDVNPALLPAAERNVFAHLIDLEARGLVGAAPQIGLNAGFYLV